MKQRNKKPGKPKNRKRRRIIWYCICGLLLLLGVAAFVLCQWFLDTFDVGLNELIYTLLSPLKGAGTGIISDAVGACLPPVLAALFGYAVLVFLDCRDWAAVQVIFFERWRLNVRTLLRRLIGIGCVGVLVASLLFANRSLCIVDYVKRCLQSTKIYEEEYIDPETVDITAEAPRNLIYIFMESMETIYTSKNVGGSQEINFIPNLTALAENNASFSNTELLGGARCTTGSGWTMAALLAQTSGIPFSFPVNGNTMGERERFASGLTTLGDILNEKGYVQEFLCGSDADFAGRRSYFEQHGNYEIFDLFTARELGYIPEDYYTWWGFEDEYLYEIAKDELLRLADGEEPFNLTMLTVDTHHEGGYVCELCEDTYDIPLENVLQCADSQVMEFIQWCRNQSFYENTTIVITGDHPRMDTILVADTDYADRTIYNCYLNAAVEPQGRETMREFTTLDFFPTTLAAMGFEIPGDRLGLGTNLFSMKETLAEELGYEVFNGELQKSSAYYIHNFS